MEHSYGIIENVSSSNSKEWKIAEAIVEMSIKHKLDFTGNEQQWFKIGCSLKIFREDGRSLFIRLSQLRASYCEKKAYAEYDKCLIAMNKIGFPSFIYYSQTVGIHRDRYMVFYGTDMVTINI